MSDFVRVRKPVFRTATWCDVPFFRNGSNTEYRQESFTLYKITITSHFISMIHLLIVAPTCPLNKNEEVEMVQLRLSNISSLYEDSYKNFGNKIQQNLL